MIITIDAISRKQVSTAHGIKNSIGIKPLETEITDVNGNTIDVFDRWLSGFETPSAKSWAKGMQVELDIVEKDGKYLNFKPHGEASGARVPASPQLEARVKKLEDAVFGGQ